MNAIELQQLKDEITEKMIEGLQNQNFDNILEKYDVLGKAQMIFHFTLNLDASESIDAKNISDQEVAPQACGIYSPCRTNPNLSMCYQCI
ncbi:hypothetical protein RIVM261_060050 [Rivularia sp. IAM M-261]|nr:hypothetical protein CAL7716_035530 [Calothrix sp. PCC 7716]GJD21049.1 hypothetical protein RIVM261_060050 [Rivularia sp. IAM M-261]